jgi:hypothetical protein
LAVGAWRTRHTATPVTKVSRSDAHRRHSGANAAARDPQAVRRRKGAARAAAAPGTLLAQARCSLLRRVAFGTVMFLGLGFLTSTLPVWAANAIDGGRIKENADANLGDFGSFRDARDVECLQ